MKTLITNKFALLLAALVFCSNSFSHNKNNEETIISEHCEINTFEINTLGESCTEPPLSVMQMAAIKGMALEDILALKILIMKTAKISQCDADRWLFHSLVSDYTDVKPLRELEIGIKEGAYNKYALTLILPILKYAYTNKTVKGSYQHGLLHSILIKIKDIME